MSASREAARFPAKNSQPNQSCSGAALVAAIIPRPEVMDSSTTIAFSGKNFGIPLPHAVSPFDYLIDRRACSRDELNFPECSLGWVRSREHAEPRRHSLPRISTPSPCRVRSESLASTEKRALRLG